MEKEPIFENENNPEQQEEQQLIQMLKERGIEDPEVKNTLITLIIKQEAEVEKLNDSVATIQLNLRIARLYFEAGYTEEAFDNFEDVRKQADYEQEEELYQAIEKEMNDKGI